MIEIWKDIQGHEGKYQVSNLGGFKRLQHSIDRGAKGIITYKGRVLTPWVHKEGYLYVELNKICYKAHRLVAKHFIDNPSNKPTVNHIDGDKSNNNSSNLEWATNKEQYIHSVNTGLFHHSRGEEHGNSKFKNSDIIAIREKHAAGDSLRKIGREYNSLHSVIKLIVIKKSWSHV